jgi:RimJ/RimL family protein N-acetyltransferase
MPKQSVARDRSRGALIVLLLLLVLPLSGQDAASIALGEGDPVAALKSSDALTRAAAARVLLVRAVTDAVAPLRAALTNENDANAAREEMRALVAEAIANRERGTELPFATVERASGRVVGGTRFLNIDAANRRVEIGWTWIAPPWQRTALNTEAKLLMLRHAFEVMGCIRVELKTDAQNAKSRAAIARLGAKEEGTLRRHAITTRGRIRDTVYYSIIDDEWPAVAARLAQRLEH